MKELLTLDNICENYAQMKNGSSFFSTHSVLNHSRVILKVP